MPPIIAECLHVITVNQQLQDISMNLRKGTIFETDSYQITTAPKTVRSERNVLVQPPTKKCYFERQQERERDMCSRGKMVNPLLILISGKGISILSYVHWD